MYQFSECAQICGGARPVCLRGQVRHRRCDHDARTDYRTRLHLSVAVNVAIRAARQAGCLTSAARFRPMAPTDGQEETGALLADIPQSANALGSATAPVTLLYFGDLQCPFCRDFTLEVLPSIIERWVRADDLRIEYHALETATREPEVFVAQQVAALAAGEQGRGTSSRPSIASRERRARATSQTDSSRESPARSRPLTSRSGTAIAMIRSWPVRSPQTPARPRAPVSTAPRRS